MCVRLQNSNERLRETRVEEWGCDRSSEGGAFRMKMMFTQFHTDRKLGGGGVLLTITKKPQVVFTVLVDLKKGRRECVFT